MKTINLLCAAACAMASSIAAAATISTATLTGFIQNGTISNNIGSDANITSVVYDLGTPGNGIATWDTSTGGGNASNFLSDPRYFQTVTWNGLNIAPGSSFSFSSLDIDLIQSLSPLSVTGSVLDNLGTSLINASISIFWSNGDFGSTPLVQQAWLNTQNLVINGHAPDGQVPEPSSIALLAIGLMSAGLLRKKQPRS